MNRTISTLASSFILLLTLVNIFVFINREDSVFVEESSDEAITYWQDIINQHPSFKDGYLVLAEIQKDRGNLEAARVLLEEAKRLSPNEDVIQLSLR